MARREGFEPPTLSSVVRRVTVYPLPSCVYVEASIPRNTQASTQCRPLSGQASGQNFRVSLRERRQEKTILFPREAYPYPKIAPSIYALPPWSGNFHKIRIRPTQNGAVVILRDGPKTWRSQGTPLRPSRSAQLKLLRWGEGIEEGRLSHVPLF